MVIASFQIFKSSEFNVRNGSHKLKREPLGFVLYYLAIVSRLIIVMQYAVALFARNNGKDLFG